MSYGSRRFGLERLPVKVFDDERGRFTKFELKDLNVESSEPISICHTLNTHKGTVRGFHAQLFPNEEYKFVFCLIGQIFDVALDIRLDFETFGETHSQTLSQGEEFGLLIPPGFAHAYQVLKPNTVVGYAIIGKHSTDYELRINAMDPNLGVNWPEKLSYISTQDAQAMTIAEYARNRLKL